MTMQRARPRVSWELIAIITIVVVLGVGVSLWFASPKGQGELIPPDPALEIAWSQLPTGITDDGLPFVGSADAPVTVTEFSDFQCPFCSEFVRNKLPELLNDYIEPGDVRLVWVAVGFDGAESVEAGKAAMCALEQGRFWEMHDWLYANQSAIPNSGAFSRERVLALSTAAGVDTGQLIACMDDPAAEKRIRDNEAMARAQSVDSTPNFLVGDRLIEGADLVALRAVLDDALQR